MLSRLGAKLLEFLCNQRLLALAESATCAKKLVDCIVGEILLFKHGVVVVYRVGDWESAENCGISYRETDLVGIGFLESLVVINVLGGGAFDADSSFAEMLDNRQQASEMAEVVKLGFKVIYVHLLRLCVGEDQCFVYLDSFCGIKADFHRFLIGNIYFDGEENKGRLDKSFAGTLGERTKYEGITDVQLVFTGFTIDFLNLTLQLLDLRHLVFNDASLTHGNLLSALAYSFLIFLGRCALLGRNLLNVLSVTDVIGQLSRLVMADEGEGMLSTIPEEVDKLGDLFLATLENSSYVIGAFSNYILKIKALVFAADLNQAFFVICVYAFTHCNSAP